MTDAPDGFGRLHPSVRYLVREVLRFPALRPVQAQTIIPVLEGRDKEGGMLARHSQLEAVDIGWRWT